MPVEAVHRGVEQARVDALGVGHDQRVDRADSLGGGVDQGLRSGWFGEVDRDQLDPSTAVRQLSGQVLRIIRAGFEPDPIVIGTPVRQHQVPPVGGEPGCQAGFDPATPSHTGNNCGSVHRTVSVS